MLIGTLNMCLSNLLKLVGKGVPSRKVYEPVLTIDEILQLQACHAQEASTRRRLWPMNGRGKELGLFRSRLQYVFRDPPYDLSDCFPLRGVGDVNR